MRLVSLCPSTTETLIAYGLGASLVGITKFCIHPADIVRDISKVGGTKNPDVAKIRALAPDLVLMNAEENRKEDHAALAETLRVDVTHPRTVGEVPALLRHFGAVTDARDRAEDHARKLEDALSRLASTPSWRYAYLIWKKPWMAAGTGTYIADLFARAGGVNVVAAPLYPEVTLEAIAAKRPDQVILPDEPFPFGAEHVPEVASVVGPRVVCVSGDDACWHGMRSIRGVALAASLGSRFRA